MPSGTILIYPASQPMKSCILADIKSVAVQVKMKLGAAKMVTSKLIRLPSFLYSCTRLGKRQDFRVNRQQQQETQRILRSNTPAISVLLKATAHILAKFAQHLPNNGRTVNEESSQSAAEFKRVLSTASIVSVYEPIYRKENPLCAMWVEPGNINHGNHWKKTFVALWSRCFAGFRSKDR